MSNLPLINDLLNNSFKYDENHLYEEQTNMLINLDKKGCISFIFQFDKQLGKDYKGGIFPFFNTQKQGLCKVCDYLIFSEINKKLFALIIELKLGKQSTSAQLNAGECFIDFIKVTSQRVYKKNIDINVRKISIREFERKRKTKIRDIEYDENNHHFFDQDKFVIRSFLK